MKWINSHHKPRSVRTVVARLVANGYAEVGCQRIQNNKWIVLFLHEFHFKSFKMAAIGVIRSILDSDMLETPTALDIIVWYTYIYIKKKNARTEHGMNE